MLLSSGKVYFQLYVIVQLIGIFADGWMDWNPTVASTAGLVHTIVRQPDITHFMLHCN